VKLFSKLYIKLKQEYKSYKRYKRAYTIGYRAGEGRNVYLTFGSDKTITKDAEDSYKRYSMAMKHYNQTPCDKESFFQGYNDAKKNTSL